MNYAIVDTGGQQFLFETGKYYDLNYINSNPGDILNFNRILFLRHQESIKVGYPCLDNVKIVVKVLKHLRGRKLTIFKMKPKKNFRVKQGHRQKITRVLVESIHV